MFAAVADPSRTLCSPDLRNTLDQTKFFSTFFFSLLPSYYRSSALEHYKYYNHNTSFEEMRNVFAWFHIQIIHFQKTSVNAAGHKLRDQ